jgi:deoxyribonuclease V
MSLPFSFLIQVKPIITHPWDVTVEEAKEIQNSLLKKLILTPSRKKIRILAGIDTSFNTQEGKCFTAIVLLSYPQLEILEELYVVEDTLFPYIPGFLTFREGPSIVSALKRVTIQPDLLMCDGQGIAHPRNLGIASHIGILFDLPSIGCAKSRLCGTYGTIREKKGSSTPLMGKDGKAIGTVLRTRSSVKPVFVSPGHRMNLKTSERIVLASTTKYRLPEPTRQADKLSKRAKKLLGK